MLVCNVSLRPPRRAIAVIVAEATTAADATATGNVIFATLVDDPASVGDIVDAYLGETMFEAASATDVLTTGIAYSAAVDEAVTAIDAQDGIVSSVVGRSAMVPGVLVNPGTSREAHVIGTMVNQ